MPLEVGNLGAAEENILTSPSRAFVFLDLNFHDLRRVLYDLPHGCPVTRTNFAQDTFVDPDNTTDQPVTLKNSQ